MALDFCRFLGHDHLLVGHVQWRCFLREAYEQGVWHRSYRVQLPANRMHHHSADPHQTQDPRFYYLHDFDIFRHEAKSTGKDHHEEREWLWHFICLGSRNLPPVQQIRHRLLRQDTWKFVSMLDLCSVVHHRNSLVNMASAGYVKHSCFSAKVSQRSRIGFHLLVHHCRARHHVVVRWWQNPASRRGEVPCQGYPRGHSRRSSLRSRTFRFQNRFQNPYEHYLVLCWVVGRKRNQSFCSESEW